MAGFHSDLRWWSCFLPIWNGACPMSWSKPIIDRSSRFVQDLRPSHRRISRLSRSNLGAGSRTVIVLESSSTPRKVRTVLGPYVFLEATGTPRAWQRDRALVKACSHCLESGAPKRRKSSK